MTPRLYFDDPLLGAFEARVLEANDRGVVLERTAFYPEAGGQMADRGKLSWDGGEAAVIDVQADEGGIVRHRLEGGAAPPAPGLVARGAIDLARRRVHMSLHTGQHLLSRALLDEAAAPTVSARLGETACTIDVDVAALAERDLQRAEDLVNSIIDDARPIRAYFPTEAELAGLALRRAPKVERDVRVVEVEGFDVTPCGGTHCSNTAMVGLVKVVATERYKGKIRIGFTAGARARAELGFAHGELERIARELTCGPADVGAALGKLRSEVAAARDVAKQLSGELARRIADEIAAAATASGERVVVRTVPLAGVELLRAIAAEVTRRAPCAVVLAGSEPSPGAGAPVVASRGPSSEVDCGAALKRIAAAAGGRGGGRPEHAEGRLPGGVDLEEVARRALA